MSANKSLSLPDFLIIGAARSGTTTLYKYLKQHPQIFLPKNKRPEPHFFLKEQEYQKGIEYYSQKYFSGVSEDLVAGEASTSYLYQPYVPKRIKKHIPKVKLVVVLRNPVERTISNYKVSVENGLEKYSLEKAIAKESERINNPPDQFHKEIQPFAYLDRSRYFKQLKRYNKYFSGEQMKIIIFEEFIQYPLKVLREIYRFLEVNEDFKPSNLSVHLNKTSKNSKFSNSKLREKIYKELEQDIKKTANLINKDLSIWAE